MRDSGSRGAVTAETKSTSKIDGSVPDHGCNSLRYPKRGKGGAGDDPCASGRPYAEIQEELADSKGGENNTFGKRANANGRRKQM